MLVSRRGRDCSEALAVGLASPARRSRWRRLPSLCLGAHPGPARGRRQVHAV